MELKFGDKESGKKLLEKIQNRLLIDVEECTCPHCLAGEHVTSVYCMDCNHEFIEFDPVSGDRDPDDIKDEIEKEYDSKCPNCGAALDDNKHEIDKIKNLYGL